MLQLPNLVILTTQYLADTQRVTPEISDLLQFLLVLRLSQAVKLTKSLDETFNKLNDWTVRRMTWHFYNDVQKYFVKKQLKRKFSEYFCSSTFFLKNSEPRSRFVNNDSRLKTRKFLIFLPLLKKNFSFWAKKFSLNRIMVKNDPILASFNSFFKISLKCGVEICFHCFIRTINLNRAPALP